MFFKRLRKLEEKVDELSVRSIIAKAMIDSMNNVKIGFENASPFLDPYYATEGDSGFDMRAWLLEEENDVKVDKTGALCVEIPAHERRLVHTGIKLELPEDVEAQVRPRSGCSLKRGLSVANAPGTIDSSYRGEICIIALNTTEKPITITNGERIAQCVICPVFNSYKVKFEKLNEVNKQTQRGEGGFGHTGTN